MILITMSQQPFPTTAWTLIRTAKGRGGPEYAATMNRFISCYWRPVFYFIRARGRPHQQAEDLTQEFFLRCLERDWLAKADPQRGRFRTYLLTILVRFLSDDSPARAPKQKTFDRNLVAISALMAEDDRRYEPPADETPEAIFMRQWASSLVDRVRQRVAVWCDEQGRADWYAVFTAHHFRDSAADAVSQRSLADRFGITRDQVRYGISRCDERFGELLRQEVEGQVDPTEDIDAEIRELLKLLAK